MPKINIDEFLSMFSDGKYIDGKKIKKAYIGITNPIVNRNLPEDYTQVEYIQSSGTQYIDTGFKPNQNTKLIIDFEVTSLPPTYGAIFSARNNGSGVSAFSLWVNPSTPCFLWQYNTGNGKSTAKNSPTVVGTRLVAENTGNVMNVGGFDLTESSATFNTNYSIYLLATNDPDTNRYCISAKIYSCQIYDNGTLVRDYIPCKNASGTAGLYDLANGVFYNNVGTGTFETGNTVANKEIAHKLKKGFVGTANPSYRNLPEGYTQVNYIQSSGAQYIDTGFTPNQNSRVVMDCEANTLTSGGIFPFGVRTSTSSAAFNVAVTTTQVFANFYTTYQFADYGNTYERMTIDMNKNTTTFIGSSEVTISLTNGNFVANGTLILANLRQAGLVLDSNFGWNGKIYSCQVYDNDILVRDYVPCIKSSGEIGLYDMIEEKFYNNAGTGAFTAGSYTNSQIACLLFKTSAEASTMPITYSGNYTDQVVTMGDGKQYRLLTITSTGTLTLEEEVQAEVWMCGGGSTAGTHGNNTYLKVRGGNGSNFLQTTMKLQEAVIVVGSGNGGVTSVNNGSVEIKNNASGSITGGGGGMYSTGTLGNPAGTGGAKAGGDTRPFKDSYFTKYPCAGGAGGNYYYASDAGYASSGQGGEGGSSLRAGNKGGYDPSIAPAGGETGGGKGGTATARHTYSSGGSASYYGSGGGGGGYTSGTTSGSSGGNGYQGVCYIRIPLEQS